MPSYFASAANVYNLLIAKHGIMMYNIMMYRYTNTYFSKKEQINENNR